MATVIAPGGGSSEMGASTTYLDLTTLVAGGVTGHAILRVIAEIAKLYAQMEPDAGMNSGNNREPMSKSVVVDALRYTLTHVGTIAWTAGVGFSAGNYNTFRLSIERYPNMETRSIVYKVIFPYSAWRKPDTTNLPHQVQ